MTAKQTTAKQYGFYIDSQRCTGCKTCELACKDYKDLTPDVSFRRIYEYCGGGWKQEGEAWTQDVFSYYLSISCNHSSVIPFLPSTNSTAKFFNS